MRFLEAAIKKFGREPSALPPYPTPLYPIINLFFQKSAVKMFYLYFIFYILPPVRTVRIVRKEEGHWSVGRTVLPSFSFPLFFTVLASSFFTPIFESSQNWKKAPDFEP